MVEFCKSCLMPDTRPRVVFTDGECNACHWARERKKIDYTGREEQFLDLVAEKKRHPAYDCIVPFSGGKDSAAIALRLKDMGLNPLLVTYGQLLWTDVGRRNFNRVCEAGFDIQYWRVNQDVSRKLACRFFQERGHPKQHYDAAVNSVPVHAAKQMGIPLVVFAEHGESEYGGLVLSEDHRRRRDLAEVLENQVGDDARNWAADGLTESDLWPYTYPEDVEGIEAVYFSWYFPWDILENARLCRSRLGFEPAKNGPQDVRFWGKSDGSFEGFDSIDDKIDDLDYYMMWIKFGFGRATRMASRLIQRGHMTREEGLELVREHDGELPLTYADDVLRYLGLTYADMSGVIQQHKNPELWDGNELRFKPK